jgi:O-antigen ligase
LVALEGWRANVDDSQQVPISDRGFSLKLQLESGNGIFENGIIESTKGVESMAWTATSGGQPTTRALALQRRPQNRWSSNAAKLVGSIAILGALLFFIDFRNIGSTLYGIGAPSLFACVALLSLSQYLSSVRFHCLLRDYGIEAPRHEVFRANIYSIVAGMLLFNVFGQGVTRSVLLNRYRVPQSTIFFLTLIERAIALLVLLVAAFISAAFLFRRFPLPVGDGGALLLRYVIVGALVLVCGLAFGLTRRQRRHMRLFFRNFASIAMLRLTGITLLMHGATLACYLIIATNVVPTAFTGETAAASIIVMLVAALPVSFAGWGFRELSASLAFSHIGFTTEQGFAVGVVIGLLSLLALVCNTAWVGLRPSGSAGGGHELPLYPVASRALQYPVYWLFALGATVAVLFQVRIPTHSGELNVNLGDPIAMMGGLVVLGLAWQTRMLSQFWRVPWLVQALGLVSLVLAVGLAHSCAVYGPIDWAIFNRFVGWLVLLGYFCSGTLIVIVSGRAGFGALCRVLVAGSIGLVIWELAHRLLAVGFDVVIGELPMLRAEAVAGNPNAFMFQLLMAFAALIASTDFRYRSSSIARPAVCAGLLLTGMWLAGSRAGIGALAVMIVIPLLFRTTTDRAMYLRKLVIAVLVGAFALIVPDFVTALVSWSAGRADLFGTLSNIHVGMAIDTADVQADRIESLRGGLALWATHPIFGAGLGAYIHDHIVKSGTPLIIHNSVLWVAAELGLIGLCAFGFLFVVIGKAVRTQRAWAGADSQVLVVGCIAVVAVMSLVHDMIYQRPLWLLLGAAMASPCALAQARLRQQRDVAAGSRSKTKSLAPSLRPVAGFASRGVSTN